MEEAAVPNHELARPDRHVDRALRIGEEGRGRAVLLPRLLRLPISPTMQVRVLGRQLIVQRAARAMRSRQHSYKEDARSQDGC